MIKRYYATKDNTITDSYKIDSPSSSSLRATGSNMGASDILEVFSIYGACSSGSVLSKELSRVIIEFDMDSLKADRDNNIIPSGSSYYIKMCNAPHVYTTPQDFKMSVVQLPANGGWQEGFGLDMNSYSDLTYDVTGSNWIRRAENHSWPETGAIDTSTLGLTLYKSFDQYFKTGTENLEVNITPLVNAWLADPSTHAGVAIRLSASFEQADRSYYTKKFYSRSTSNFFKKPYIEARWNSTMQDDRGNFYANSTAVPDGYNINTLFFYNYARGNLVNVADAESNIYVDLYDAPGGNRISQYSAMGTSSNPSAGVYKVKVRVDTTASVLYDVWHSGWDSNPRSIYHTGTINIKSHKFSEVTDTNNYVLSVSNKNQSYYHDQTHRIRVYARYKNWSPSIYTKATSVPSSLTFQSASYQVYRVVDDQVVIPYGTGSTQATALSYDISGNYFDLDMSILEPNYTYGINFSVYDPDTKTYEEQPYEYKFRVVKNEY